ncbi:MULTISPECIES: GH1 family beta-glucosidase [unclassified Microbacterium]|uniref:GH1 family beta-glucosidase n=1 Tax=unclassified Microbacterium TaxID=2609290 RepID=UPI000EAA8C13|nr:MULTISPECIES: GH1 family beta-glucosidase [unclassified Microbacterium]MBT2483801.1 beta-glucosidase [Microbacterium sp. ISL-108]RKN66787.1 beta-glucosidase [Microbacterium sp. CGR2]
MTAFPADFLWGAATSAYQIEGSLDVDGRGRSIWDTFAEQPGAIEGGGDARVACDSYRRWKDDLEILSELGMKAYRFSLAWSRIMPDGRGRVNSRGLDHYERIIDELRRREIEPIVTLNHWDMPEALMADGGWMGRGTVDAFTEYAVAASERLGDRVDWWVTQNEPWIIQLLGYQLGLHAPGIHDLRGAVTAGHHLLLAHGRAADAMRASTTGNIGVALNLLPCVPATSSAADADASWGSDGYVNRWFLDPLLREGYPDDMRRHWERAIGGSLDDVILAGDEAAIAGRSDFLGINFYTHRVMAAAEPGPRHPFPWQVVGSTGEVERTDEGTEIVPDAFRDLLIRVHHDYPGVPLIVTENGAISGDSPTHDGEVHDVRRTRYLRSHVAAMAEAIEAGAPVVGYTHWSLLDNFEWALGYRPRFGLVYVDFRTGERIVKDSAREFAQIVRDVGLTQQAAARGPQVDSLGAFG